jgi:hypothetical protein
LHASRTINLFLEFFPQLQISPLKTHCLVRWKPDEQPSLIGIINVLRFEPSVILGICSFLYSLTVEDSILLQSPSTVLYTALCHCLKSLIQPLESLKSSRCKQCLTY